MDEELGFEPDDEGFQLFLQVRKSELATSELISAIANNLEIDRQLIGYAGLKDRQSISTQWLSLPLDTLAKRGLPRSAVEAKLAQLESTQLQVIQTRLNRRKLRIGSHRSNQFRIRLRDFSDPHHDFLSRLETVKNQGVPNYFGEQRFGHDFHNLSKARQFAAKLLERQNSAATTSSASTKPPKLRKQTDRFLVSVVRSYLFNEILSLRVRVGNWDQYLEGEVFSLEGSSQYFRLKPDETWSGDYPQRLQRLDIHPSGLLAGLNASELPSVGGQTLRPVANKIRRTMTSAKVAQLEAQVLAQHPQFAACLEALQISSARRALRLKPGKFNWKFADNLVELNFSLASGQYATAILRELVDY